VTCRLLKRPHRKASEATAVKAKNGKTKTVGKLPFVLLNVAMTADGKIATANRAVSSFGSLYDKDHLMELRATTDAVMSGARTADLNDITLGPGSAKYRRARLRHGLAEYNLRIIVSGLGTINPRAEIFKRRCIGCAKSGRSNAWSVRAAAPSMTHFSGQMW